MKTYMPLDGFRWSCDSDSALCDMRQTNVLGRAGGGKMTFLFLIQCRAEYAGTFACCADGDVYRFRYVLTPARPTWLERKASEYHVW